MIPILYEANETSFSTLGIGALAETSQCEVTEERNGIFELSLKYPTTGLLFNELKNDRIIKAKTNDTSNEQAFRIYKITIPINGLVTVKAQHISYDLASVGIIPFELENVTPTIAIQRALNKAVIPHNFSFTSNCSESHDFKILKPQSLRECLGGKENSLLSLWGGEFEWDNFVIKHYNHRGSDNGVIIDYGKNLTKFENDKDVTSIYTDLYPYAINKTDDGEEIITLSEKVIPVTTTLTNRKTYIKDFTSFFDRDVEITEALLRGVAEDYIENNPFGIETPSITISFEPLQKQSEYHSLFERVGLCDTVTVRHSLLGITTKSLVTKTIYNTLAEKFKSITLGPAKDNLVTQIKNITKQVDETSELAKDIPGVVDKAITDATEKITGNKGGYVVLHSNAATKKPYELLILDNEDLLEAENVWRWNLNGLGFSSSGYSGPYGTAITSDGSIVADYITSGSLNADVIKAGTIISSDSSSYWNLESGDLSIKGKIESNEGKIGGFTIDSNSIHNGTLGTAGSVLISKGTTGSASIGGSEVISGWAFTAGSYFGVTKDGNLYANNVELTGNIKTTSGSIDIGDGAFTVDTDGHLNATSADIEGSIVATGRDSSININNNFIVTTDGILTAKDANISGNMDVTDLSAENVYVDYITINGLKIAGDNSGTTTTVTATFSAEYQVEHSSTQTIITVKGHSDINVWESTPLNIMLKGLRFDDEKAISKYYSKSVRVTISAGNRTGVTTVTINDPYIVIREITSIFPEAIMYSRVESYPGFMFEGNVVPYYNGGYDLGSPLKKWDDIYANNASITTSDRKSKKDISYDISAYDLIFDKLKPASFKYIDGTSNRTHLGFIAQDIEETLKNEEIDSKDFACLIKKLVNEDEPNPEDKDFLYGLRLGELHALEVYEIQMLKKKVLELEEKLKEVKDG